MYVYFFRILHKISHVHEYPQILYICFLRFFYKAVRTMIPAHSPIMILTIMQFVDMSLIRIPPNVHSVTKIRQYQISCTTTIRLFYPKHSCFDIDTYAFRIVLLMQFICSFHSSLLWAGAGVIYYVVATFNHVGPLIFSSATTEDRRCYRS